MISSKLPLLLIRLSVKLWTMANSNTKKKKKAQNARKKQVVIELKEVQLRPKTDVHDLGHKAKSTLGFLADGDKAKITVVFRGSRIRTRGSMGCTMVEFITMLKDQATCESPPRLEGKRLSCILAPLPKGKTLAVGGIAQACPNLVSRNDTWSEDP